MFAITNISAEFHIPDDRNPQESFCYVLSLACFVPGIFVVTRVCASSVVSFSLFKVQKGDSVHLSIYIWGKCLMIFTVLCFWNVQKKLSGRFNLNWFQSSKPPVSHVTQNQVLFFQQMDVTTKLNVA